MNEREALLHAVCENPDDDTPRLVFADWLQENGDESDSVRAEFIRAQIELLQYTPHTIPWHKCDSRARTLLAAHEARWRQELPSDPGLRWGWEFRRGFLELLFVSDFGVFERLAERLFAAAPLREVSLGGSYRLSTWGRFPQLRRLARLEGRAPDCTPGEAEELVRAFAQHRLTRLYLFNGVTDDEARRILVGHFGSVIGFPVV